ncbi:hypothetical protein [Niastella populi]|uniref:Uncharacterized protein n=1 Tax=Niastella populi TaxID=550983 RepID=A0A1V9ESN0_9BACT|nr:hypothetical protein [Niastella populi]OQP48924.1 hypothetical protein A4R26_31270 [Niastella populi]
MPFFMMAIIAIYDPEQEQPSVSVDADVYHCCPGLRRIPEGQILAAYDRNGKLIRTAEKEAGEFF